MFAQQTKLGILSSTTYSFYYFFKIMNLWQIISTVWEIVKDALHLWVLSISTLYASSRCLSRSYIYRVKLIRLSRTLTSLRSGRVFDHFLNVKS